MNDRMQIAAMAMQGMLANSSLDVLAPEEYASDAVRYADALIAALAVTALAKPSEDIIREMRDDWPDRQAAGEYDAVGDWRRYVAPHGKQALIHVAEGDMTYVADALYWMQTPQGATFWRNIGKRKATAADKARAQDFARRVLEAMEAEDD